MDIDLSKIEYETRTFTRNVFKIDHDDWETEYARDLATGNAIIMDDPQLIIEGEIVSANDNSLFDSRFDVPLNVDESVIDYGCECGKRVGRWNETLICPECNTPTTIRYGVNLLKRGWIDLGNYKIIAPAIYTKIRSFIGNKKLKEILDYEVKIDGSGNKLAHVESTDKSNPFKNIGIEAFRQRYEEILEFFSRKTTKPDLYKVLMDRRDITFTSKILVMSPAHRPGFVSTASKRTFNYHNINRLFVQILADLKLITSGRRTGGKAIEMISLIQENAIHVYNATIQKLIGKHRLIRSGVISGRLWYTSRMVIIAETEAPDYDSIRMSYKGFIGLYEVEIINCMLRGHGNPLFAKMTAPECFNYMRKVKYSNEVDPFIYKIIKMLINDRKDDGLYVLVNRNPSFDLGSIQCFRIYDVFEDARKFVLTIPHNSLTEFTGDYDGDVLNVFALKEKCVSDAFREGCCPSKLMIDRSGAYYNPRMPLIKDEISMLQTFCNANYKPIDTGDIELKSLEEILNGVKEFDYKEYMGDDTTSEDFYKRAPSGMSMYCDVLDVSASEYYESNNKLDIADEGSASMKFTFDPIAHFESNQFVRVDSPSFDPCD